MSLFGPGAERSRDIKAEQKARRRADNADRVNESTRRTVTVEELKRRGK